MGKNDPLNPGKTAANLGSAALARGGSGRWELADVVAYNDATHTAVVRTHTGRPLQNVPQMTSSPNEMEHLHTGTTVIVSYDLGMPVIIGCISFGGSRGIIPPTVITGFPQYGDENEHKPTLGTNNYKPPTAPVDLTQGDWARVGTMGNHVSVLEGGVTSMGSPTALVRSLGTLGILQLISRRTQNFTDFGEWHADSEQGRTSFVLRGGSNLKTQSGIDEENWTIRLDMGASGDLFNFEITEPQGRTLFKLHVSPDGRVQMYGDGGVDISSGIKADAATVQDIAGTRATNVGQGEVLSVEGSRSTQIGGTDKTSIASDETAVVGGSASRMVNGDVTSTIGGKVTEVVAGGAPQDARPGATARATKILNGGWDVDIGNPAAGANPAARAGFHVKAHSGDVAMDTGPTGMVKLNGTEHPLPKFDVFLHELSSFLTTLLSGLSAGGVAPSAGGPTPLVTLMGSMATLQSFVNKVRTGLPYTSTKARNG